MKKNLLGLLKLTTLLLLSGCAAVPYYVDAGYSDVMTGDRIKVSLTDGTNKSLVVSEIDDAAIRSDGGEVIVRQDVDEIRVRIASSDIPCSSWASWRNVNCWAP